MGIRDRLRKLEERFHYLRPTPDEVQSAWGRAAESARSKLLGEGVDLGAEAERAKVRVRDVDRARE
jgi:hypothetical protein